MVLTVSRRRFGGEVEWRGLAVWIGQFGKRNGEMMGKMHALVRLNSGAID